MHDAVQRRNNLSGIPILAQVRTALLPVFTHLLANKYSSSESRPFIFGYAVNMYGSGFLTWNSLIGVYRNPAKIFGIQQK